MTEEATQAPEAEQRSVLPAPMITGPGVPTSKIWGGILLAAGLVTSIVSYLLPTSVPSDYSSLGSSYGASTYNIGLMQQQMVVLHSGIGLALIGAVLIGAGAIVGEMRDQERVRTRG